MLIADDQEMVRTGFQMILDAQPDIEVVAAVADGVEAVEQARRLRPDVCLLDIRMPRLDGLEATRLLAGPGVPDPMRVVIVTTFDLDEYVYGALRARGLRLPAQGQRADAADRGGAGGGRRRLAGLPLGDRAAAQAPGPAHGPQARRPREPLTERELDVVRLVARGRTNQEVAAELFVSLSTVKTHLASIQAKLGARNRVEIAAWAWESGIVS